MCLVCFEMVKITFIMFKITLKHTLSFKIDFECTKIAYRSDKLNIHLIRHVHE